MVGKKQSAKPSMKKDAHIWGLTALVIGYNELAKKTEVLGDKAFFRLSRDAAEAELVSLGGKPILEPQAYVLEIDVPASMIGIRFRTTDIEMMRKCVAEHDLKRATPSSSKGDGT